MTKNTVSAGGGAVPSVTLRRQNLIDEETGEVNVWVLKGLARREAMQTFGVITPLSLRSAIRQYGSMLPELQCAWRQRHDLPVGMTTVAPFGRQQDGVRRSAF